MPKLTDDDRTEIIRLYLAGEKVEAIACRFGVAPSYPGLLAKRCGKALRTPQRHRDNMSDSALSRRPLPARKTRARARGAEV